MIKIWDKHNCCGCLACLNACPKKCISLKPDTEGFSYPIADESICINCGICEKVCPFLNPHKNSASPECFAMQSKNCEILKKCSSGGVFPELAKETLSRGGIVFGAAYTEDFKGVKHIAITSEDELPKIIGSKYLQSDMGVVYAQVKDAVKNGRETLFSGTPCQVAGIKNFLGNLSSRPNYLAVEIICHGVPTPKYWGKYINEYVLKKAEEIDKTAKLTEVNLRDKSDGWQNYKFKFSFTSESKSFKIEENRKKSFFMLPFLANLTIRPSCQNCKCKYDNSMADITIGDFWGYDGTFPKETTANGISCVLATTEKGREKIGSISARFSTEQTVLKILKDKNPALIKSAKIPCRKRKTFFANFENPNLLQIAAKLSRKSFFKKQAAKLTLFLTLLSTDPKRVISFFIKRFRTLFK